jgi:glycosyltransferase involved in cell wall biosynthesis
MTIIHLLIGLGGGGAENFVFELAKENKKDGLKVLVIAISSIDKLKQKFINENIEVVFLNVVGFKSFFAGLLKLRRIIQNNSEVIMHAHMFHAVIFACIVKLSLIKLPIIFTLHTNYIKSGFRKALLYVTKPLRNIDVIFSKDSRKFYHKKDAIVIENGIDLSRFNLKHNPPARNTLIFIGRLEEPKNPLYLIELVKLIKDDCDILINVVGEGRLLNDLQKGIEANNFERYFNLLGYRNDISQLLSQSHCLIVPSLWEGMPLSILEAGAIGVPVISTPVGSIGSIINESNGYLSDLDKLHLQVVEVFQSYDTALSKAGKLKSLVDSKYNIKNTAKEHLKAYNSLS